MRMWVDVWKIYRSWRMFHGRLRRIIPAAITGICRSADHFRGSLMRGQLAQLCAVAWRSRNHWYGTCLLGTVGWHRGYRQAWQGRLCSDRRCAWPSADGGADCTGTGVPYVGSSVQGYLLPRPWTLVAERIPSSCRCTLLLMATFRILRTPHLF